MAKIILGFLALVIILFVATIFTRSVVENKSLGSLFGKTPKATINKHTFNLLVAQSAKEKEVGLSDKSSLSQESGMLFPFEKPDYYSFWMKNMKFPIDIIYINKNKVVTVYQDVKPPKSQEESVPIYKPEEQANMVLEINSGLSKKYGIKKGDEVKFEDLPK